MLGRTAEGGCPDIIEAVLPLPLRLCDCAFRSRGHQGAVFAEDAGSVARLWLLPVRHAPMDFSITDFEFQHALVHVNANCIAFMYGCDWSTQRRFRRDVPHHQAVSSAAEAAISDQSY